MISSTANELRHVYKGQYVKVYTSSNTFEIGVVVTTTATSGLDGSQSTKDHHNHDEDGKEVLVQVRTQTGFGISTPLPRIRRAYLVILDLNGVLGYRCRGPAQTIHGKENNSSGKMTFVHRPNLSKLLKYLFSNFLVGVWTSGEERNAVSIIDSVFGPDANEGLDFKGRLLFCMFRQDTTPAMTPDKPYGTVKDLKKLFSQFPESFHAGNTLIIDDSVDKCSHPNNAVCPSAFTEESHRQGRSDEHRQDAPKVMKQTENKNKYKKVLLRGGNIVGYSEGQPAQAITSTIVPTSICNTHGNKEEEEEEGRKDGMLYVMDILEKVAAEDSLDPLRRAALDRTQRKNVGEEKERGHQRQGCDDNREKELSLGKTTRDAIAAMFEDTFERARRKVAEKDALTNYQ